MGVLICSLCEENREVLTKAFNDIFNSLGRRCTGHNSTFAKLACNECHSVIKTFYIYRHFKFISDVMGNFSIEWFGDITSLSTINILKKEAENFKESFFDDNIKMTCVCGHDKFYKVNHE